LRDYFGRHHPLQRGGVSTSTYSQQLLILPVL